MSTEPVTTEPTSTVESTDKPKTVRERRLGLTVRGWTIIGALLTVLFLELAPRLGLVDSFSLVPLSAMVVRASGLLIDPEFLSQDLAPSLLSILVAFIFAVVSGVLIGLLVWRFDWARKTLDPWLATYYAIPTFALYPLLVALLGIGFVPIVLLATLFAVVAMISSTVDGLDGIPRSVLRLAAVLQLDPIQRIFKVLLPAALPQISVGLRLALSYSLIMVLASEFVLSTSGLGHFISNAYNDFAITDMYAGVLLVFVLALGLNFAFAAALRPQSKRVLS
ncbi:ABC transporter permease [Arthrobacter sp. CAN_C5]|uniref:ABC transporter permease n=1 Tax=Arthrobacter sp. CAN_C5 TaxID=2760706 RepID=UPI001AE61951|nr:ABC transporter permease [Arthrobacter sp. CAN_C5]MBP2217150.1 NitT/TauT family transport system permease protein [Arthrobacter sp. CAN_C5]